MAGHTAVVRCGTHQRAGACQFSHTNDIHKNTFNKYCIYLNLSKYPFNRGQFKHIP